MPTPTSTSGATSALPPIGIYDSVANSLVPPTSYVSRLSAIGQAGFRVVIPYQALNLSSISLFVRYLDAAASMGIKVLFDFAVTEFYTAGNLVGDYPNWAASIGAVDNTSFITNTVQQLRHHPALYGWYIGDEPNPSYVTQITTYKNLIKSLDSVHPTLIVTNAAGGSSYVTTYAAPYAVGACDILGVDFYTFGNSANYPTGISGYQGVCTAAQSLWTTNSLKGALVLQGYPFVHYYTNPPYPCAPWPTCGAFPTAAQQLDQINIALLSCSPSLLLWFSYFDIVSTSLTSGGITSAQAWAQTIKASQANRH